MNKELIQKFLNKACWDEQAQHELEDWLNVEKLAELIVGECASIVEDYGLSLVGSDENYLGETLNLSIRVQEAGNKIKQHFGVEE